jgi:hypothetical protein
LYISETHTVEESIHVRFNDKETDNNMSEQVESFAEFQISSGCSEPKVSSVLVQATDTQNMITTGDPHVSE